MSISFKYQASAFSSKNEFTTGLCIYIGPEDSRTTEDERWGYVEVRPGGHMFWWLYLSTHVDGYQTRPLVLWLQVSLFVLTDMTDNLCSFHYILVYMIIRIHYNSSV